MYNNYLDVNMTDKENISGHLLKTSYAYYISVMFKLSKLKNRFGIQCKISFLSRKFSTPYKKSNVCFNISETTLNLV